MITYDERMNLAAAMGEPAQAQMKSAENAHFHALYVAQLEAIRQLQMNIMDRISEIDALKEERKELEEMRDKLIEMQRAGDCLEVRCHEF